jgi:hypothetical protein
VDATAAAATDAVAAVAATAVATLRADPDPAGGALPCNM